MSTDAPGGGPSGIVTTGAEDGSGEEGSLRLPRLIFFSARIGCWVHAVDTVCAPLRVCYMLQGPDGAELGVSPLTECAAEQASSGSEQCVVLSRRVHLVVTFCYLFCMSLTKALTFATAQKSHCIVLSLPSGECCGKLDMLRA